MTSSQVPAMGFMARFSTRRCAFSVSIILGRGTYFSSFRTFFYSTTLHPLSAAYLSDLRSAAYA